jgi:hypothetical protein
VKRILFFLLAGFAVVGTACGAAESQAQGGALEQKLGLSAVRLVGPKPTLQKMAKAAARVRWTESRFDEKGRLVLPVPPNYKSDDFGQLLNAIDPYASNLQGLQMLGPNGGPVDDKGIEHPDE